MINTPILFLIFNRPDTTQKVFDAIRNAKPKQLFVAADGSRIGKEGEKEKCESARAIINQIDWDCEVKTLFREENLGCGKAVSEAITWFFNDVEEGIILEDDCLPSQSFFRYCEELLIKYRNDERIMLISGDNFQFGKQRGDGDYYFSKMNHVWGWATWKRAWQYYDFKMGSLNKFIKNNYIKGIFNNKKISKKWIQNFIATKNGKIDTWDYQWTYTMWSQDGLAILPNINLVKNIGFGGNATHTQISNSLIENNHTHFLSISKHPSLIIRDYEADMYYSILFKDNIFKKIYFKLKNLLQ